jgi:hypothetical protein
MFRRDNPTERLRAEAAQGREPKILPYRWPPAFLRRQEAQAQRIWDQKARTQIMIEAWRESRRERDEKRQAEALARILLRHAQKELAQERKRTRLIARETLRIYETLAFEAWGDARKALRESRLENRRRAVATLESRRQEKAAARLGISRRRAAIMGLDHACRLLAIEATRRPYPAVRKRPDPSLTLVRTVSRQMVAAYRRLALEQAERTDLELAAERVARKARAKIVRDEMRLIYKTLALEYYNRDRLSDSERRWRWAARKSGRTLETALADRAARRLRANLQHRLTVPGVPLRQADYTSAITAVMKITGQLPDEIRDDVCQEMILAALDGRLPLDRLGQALPIFRKGAWVSEYAFRSLDAPLSPDDDRTLLDIL